MNTPDVVYEFSGMCEIEFTPPKGESPNFNWDAYQTNHTTDPEDEIEVVTIESQTYGR